MANNITAPATGAILATDEIGGVHYPRTKLAHGAEGAATDVSTASPLPVAIISGGGGGGGGDASAANQDEQTAVLTSILAALGVTITVDGTIELGTTALAALETTELGAATLAALESINANITGTVEIGAASLAALETTELGAASLAALENINATVAGGATEAKQDALIGHVDGIETLLGTLGTQTTAAAILAKLIAAPATEAKQDAIVTALGTLGTQTTLAAILAKLIAAPSTAANQATIIGHVDGIETLLGTLATQTTSAAILAKLIAAPATEAKQDTAIAAINGLVGNEYETVAASSADQTLGATGAAGDLIVGVLIIPGTTSPGAVSIKDGAGAAINVFAGGASSISTLHPFFVPLNIKATGAGWKVTTGANVTAIGVGNFT